MRHTRCLHDGVLGVKLAQWSVRQDQNCLMPASESAGHDSGMAKALCTGHPLKCRDDSSREESMAEQSWTPAEWCARAAAELRARLEPQQPLRPPARHGRGALAGRWRRARERGPPASGRCCARPASWSSWWSTSAASRAPLGATSSCICRRGAPRPPCATSLPAHSGL